MSFEDKMKDYCQKEYVELTKGNRELDNPDSSSEQNPSSLPPQQPQQQSLLNTGRWTKEEHLKFVEGISLYGKNWKKVEEHIKTRNGAQIRSHAQKFFNRLEREYAKKQQLSKVPTQAQQDTSEGQQKKPPNFTEAAVAQHQFQRSRKVSMDSTGSYGEPYSEEDTKEDSQLKDHLQPLLSATSQQQTIQQQIDEKKIQLLQLIQQKYQLEQQPQTEYFRLFQVNDQIKKVQGFIQILGLYQSLKEEAQKQFEVSQSQMKQTIQPVITIQGEQSRPPQMRNQSLDNSYYNLIFKKYSNKMDRNIHFSDIIDLSSKYQHSDQEKGEGKDANNKEARNKDANNKEASNKDASNNNGGEGQEQPAKRKGSFVLCKEGDAEEQAKLENLRKKNRLTDELYKNQPIKMSAFRKQTL